MTDPFSSNTRQEIRGFLSGGSVAAKFPENGFSVEGTVLSYRMAQRTHIDSGEPLFWEGRQPVEESKLQFEASKRTPCEQLIIEVQGEPTGVTWETNRYIQKKIPNDDGIRVLYVTGGLQKAFAKALQKAGGAEIESGAYVKVTKTGEVQRKGSKYHSFVYEVEWTPKATNAKGVGDFMASDPEAGPEGPQDDPFA